MFSSMMAATAAVAFAICGLGSSAHAGEQVGRYHVENAWPSKAKPGRSGKSSTMFQPDGSPIRAKPSVSKQKRYHTSNFKFELGGLPSK